MGKRSIFVVLGAGQAGVWIARTLRAEGFDGHIRLVGEEPHYPYERPPLSKAALAGGVDSDAILFWPPQTFDDLEIEVHTGCRATAIDASEKRVVLESGKTLDYDRLAIATGARPRPLQVDGINLDGVHYLRGIDDTLAIRDGIEPDAKVLVVGGGWIGLEVASTLAKLGSRPLLVESASRLCARAVTPAISEWMLELHRRNGVEIRLGTSIERFEGNGRLRRARLSNGESIDCSLAVIGIGVIPNIRLAAEAGVEVGNGVIVDEYCRTSNLDIFAAGDVSFHPNHLLGREIRLESWENAQNQGIVAARSMLGMGDKYAEIPWFWSDQHGVNIQMIGLPESWDQAVTRKDPDCASFVTLYLKQDLLVGAVAVDNPREIRIAKRLMQARKVLSAGLLGDSAIKLQNLLKA